MCCCNSRAMTRSYNENKQKRKKQKPSKFNTTTHTHRPAEVWRAIGMILQNIVLFFSVLALLCANHARLFSHLIIEVTNFLKFIFNKRDEGNLDKNRFRPRPTYTAARYSHSLCCVDKILWYACKCIVVLINSPLPICTEIDFCLELFCYSLKRARAQILFILFYYLAYVFV